MSQPGTQPRLGSQQSTAAASSLALIGAVVTTAANFVIAVLVARAGFGLAGLFWTATATATILGNSTSLGTMTGLVYFLPQAIAGDRPNPRQVITLAVGPVLAVSSAAAIALFVAAPWFAQVVARSRADDLGAMLRVLAITVPAWALTQTLMGATRGLGTMGPTVGVGQILRPGGQIVLLGLLFAVTTPTPTQVALAWALPVLCSLAVIIVTVARLGGWSREGPGAVTRREFWAFTRFRALSATMQIALERVDVIIISGLLGPAPAGVYGSLSRYISAGNFLIFSVAQAVSSHLRMAITKHDLDRVRELLQRTTAWVVLVALPYFLVVAIQAEPLARLINADLVPDAGILPVLALGMMISTIAGPIDLTLLMLGRSMASMVGVALAITTNMVLLVALAPWLGLMGAAIAWAAGVAVQNLLATWLVYRDLGFWQVARPSVLTGIGAMVAVVPIAVVAPPTLGGLVLTGVVAGTILAVFALYFQDQIGLEELVPARILNRLPTLRPSR